MATFELDLDGKTFEVEAPSFDEAVKALGVKNNFAPASANLSTQRPEESLPQRLGQFAAPALEQGSTTRDVIDSAGAGLARGAIGLAMLPGNIETLGRAATNYIGSKITGSDAPVVSPQPFFPNSREAEQALEAVRGKPLYKPTTTAGQYASTAAEFAPNMLFPGTAAQRVVTNTLAPAVVSETAGQLTEGTAAEPWARVGGALVGGALPGAASRVVTPIGRSPERAAQVATLEREGVTSLTAGQKTGSMPLRWAESAAGDVPGSGKRGAQLMEAQAEQFTSATLRRAGIDAPRATPEVLDEAFTRIGSKFDEMAQQSTLKFDADLKKKTRIALNDYKRFEPSGLQSPIVAKITNEISDLAGKSAYFMGDRYQAWRSEIERAARGASSPYLKEALRDIKKALDDAVEKSLPPKVRGEWAKARKEYRNMLVIEKAATSAGEAAATGLISPAALRIAAKSQGLRAHARNKGEFDELSKAGVAIMSKLPQSGTTPRAIASNIGKVVLGSAAGGATVGGPEGAAGGAIAPYLMQALISRGIMSRRGQQYLGNNTAAPVQNALAADAALRYPRAGGRAITAADLDAMALEDQRPRNALAR